MEKSWSGRRTWLDRSCGDVGSHRRPCERSRRVARPRSICKRAHTGIRVPVTADEFLQGVAHGGPARSTRASSCSHRSSRITGFAACHTNEIHCNDTGDWLIAGLPPHFAIAPGGKLSRTPTISPRVEAVGVPAGACFSRRQFESTSIQLATLVAHRVAGSTVGAHWSAAGVASHRRKWAKASGTWAPLTQHIWTLHPYGVVQPP